MKSILLSAWIAAHAADGITTQRAIDRGAHEVFLGQRAAVRNTLMVSQAVGGAWCVNWLWTHQHRKTAVILTASIVSLHTAAAIHNSRVLR